MNLHFTFLFLIDSVLISQLSFSCPLSTLTVKPCVERQGTTDYRIGLCSVLRPLQHSIGYMGDGFYRSKDPTNSIKVLKEKAVKENNQKNIKKTKITRMHTHTK